MKLKFLILITVLSIGLVFSQNRPQEPKAPFNYSVEDVTYVNSKAENIKLAGTLTLPKNVENPPVAILISGSGPQNRNEELVGHKPFLVLADYLTNNGIAVLRYDERGIGESEGDFSKATTFDLALDVEAGIDYLKTRTDIDISKIGLIGHSEGGVIAPIIASRNPYAKFIVLLAGPGLRGDKVMHSQNEKILKLRGYTDDALKMQLDLNSVFYNFVITEENDSIKNKIETYLDKFMIDNKDNKIANAMVNPFNKSIFSKTYANPWFREFIRLDPKPFLEKTTCPVLALNGSKDSQVLSEINLGAIKTHLETAKNKDVTIKEIAGLNHLFQAAETGAASEYAKIEETFSPTALVIIKDWILKRF